MDGYVRCGAGARGSQCAGSGGFVTGEAEHDRHSVVNQPLDDRSAYSSRTAGDECCLAAHGFTLPLIVPGHRHRRESGPVAAKNGRRSDNGWSPWWGRYRTHHGELLRRASGSYSETPGCDNHATGLISCPPFCQISKCRCGPVDWPRLPIVAICCPAFTCCPELTSASLMWPYTETLPSSCWIRTHLPNPLAGPASITFPE